MLILCLGLLKSNTMPYGLANESLIIIWITTYHIRDGRMTYTNGHQWIETPVNLAREKLKAEVWSIIIRVTFFLSLFYTPFRQFTRSG